jgi:hypothetical protein
MSSDVLISAVSALSDINQVANDLAKAPPARIPSEAVLKEMRDPDRQTFFLVGTPKGRIN